MSLPFNPEEMRKDTVHKEDGLKIELINSLADVTRQREESTIIANNRQADMLTNDMANRLIAFIKTLKTDKVTVTAIGKNLQKDDETNLFNGSVDFSFGVLHSGLTKELNLKLPVKNSSFDMPSDKVILAELEKVVSKEEKTSDELKTEMENNIKAMSTPSEDTLDKSAQMMTSLNPHPVIHVQKTWLPSSLKISDIINLDGARYKIISDDHNKMSASSDGTFWTLREVSETTDTKGSEITAS
jgi:hypothetical protein